MVGGSGWAVGPGEGILGMRAWALALKQDTLSAAVSRVEVWPGRYAPSAGTGYLALFSFCFGNLQL